MTEQEFIEDIGEILEYFSNPDINFLKTGLNINFVIADIKLEEAAYSYNIARHFYIEAELSSSNEKNDIGKQIKLNKEFFRMVHLQTSAIWLNNSIDIFLQAEYILKSMYLHLPLSKEKKIYKYMTNKNYDKISKDCNRNIVEKLSGNEKIKSFINDENVKNLKNIVNKIKHRGAIYSENVEDIFPKFSSKICIGKEENPIFDSSAFETQLIRYEVLKILVHDNLKLFKDLFGSYTEVFKTEDKERVSFKSKDAN